MVDDHQEHAVTVNQPNARFPHVYALLRHDAFHRSGARPEDTITVTKVFANQEQALREAERLNLLQQQRAVDSRYWVQITRFVPSKSV